MKKVLIIGVNGQLGQSFRLIEHEFSDLDFTYTNKDMLDITDSVKVKEYFSQNVFDFVVNCAAYTDVDGAEKNKDISYSINALAVKNLAIATTTHKIKFIHISTDYVFAGDNIIPRKETDLTNPINVYGSTKLEGERLAMQYQSNVIIIRTAWVYSRFGNNFVKTMLRLFNEKKYINVINDQIGSPTCAIDLAKAILLIIKNKNWKPGIYNYSNEGQCTWYEFAKEIKELNKVSICLKEVTTENYPTVAKRPLYNLLNKEKIKNSYHLVIPHWKDALKEEMNYMTKIQRDSKD